MRAFHVNNADTLGTLVFELGNGQWDIPELRHLLEEVLPGQTVITDYTVQHTFDQLGQRHHAAERE